MCKMAHDIMVVWSCQKKRCCRGVVTSHNTSTQLQTLKSGLTVSSDMAENSKLCDPTAVRNWTVPVSDEAKGAINSIRQCTERHFTESLEKRDKTKELIQLSIGRFISYCHCSYSSLMYL